MITYAGSDTGEGDVLKSGRLAETALARGSVHSWRTFAASPRATSKIGHSA